MAEFGSRWSRETIAAHEEASRALAKDLGVKTAAKERYGFVVYTGRHKILDYHNGNEQIIATAHNEDEARTIVRALNAYRATDKLRAALEAISRIAGNLSDEQVENLNGVNDARSRALMVVTARQIANAALE